MKVECQKEELLRGTTVVQNAVSAKSTLPILSNVLLEAQDKSLIITGTDLDIGITATIPVTVHTPGSITLPARKFFDIIKELPDAPITLTIKRNNTAHISAGKAHFKIMGIPKDDFPKLPELKNVEPITISQKLLKTMITMTSFAISRDETRYILNGVLLVVKKNSIRMVATDGRRLAFIERDAQFPKGVDVQVIIPTKTIQELNRNLEDSGDTEIYIGNNHTIFNLGDITIVSRLIEGEFPNYEQVIPPEGNKKTRAEREKLFLAIKRASLLTSQDSRAIKIDLDKGRMVISKNSPDIGESREELEVEYDGSPFSIGFNPGYLLDVLKNISDDLVHLELQDPEKPGVIRTPDNYVYVVLPMQLN